MQKKIRVTPKTKKMIPRDPQTLSFPIAGVGASAGGLEAFEELFKNLSAKPEMAFVFIMHLAPERKSMLSELLSRRTKMPVTEVTNGMLLEANHVYVIPPKANMSVANGKLVLHKLKEPSLPRMPINCFFRSLAEELGDRAIGVILSGTAADGTLGAEAIKAKGGIIFAQDVNSAKYAGMPQNVIDAGCVDFVLPPEKIAHELERIAKHPDMSRMRPVRTDESLPMKDKGLGSIFELLRRAKGLDFTYYKTATIDRRVSRRMVLLKLKKLNGYLKFLRTNKDETDNLYEDLLVNVTSFFRDPAVFDALKKQVLPTIFKNKKKGEATKIWVPGCSSGEEAYSIAICILESLGNKAGTFPVQIFATDVSEMGTTKARKGIYRKNIQGNLTPERLKGFFTKEGDFYRVSQQLRDMCVFSKQNVFSDPPFSNVDLISCRNLLIYLQPVLQKKTFQNFHYALRPNGFLLLGRSEAAGNYLNLFQPLDGKRKIFTKKYLPFGPGFKFAPKYDLLSKLKVKEKTDVTQTRETGIENMKNIEGMIDRIVLRKYAPCGVLINSNMEVVRFRGRTGRYLESATGKPSMDVFKLAREGLFLPLRAAIYEAKKTKRTVKGTADKVKHNGYRMQVNITVVPVRFGTLQEEFFLVLFDERNKAVASKNLPKARGRRVKNEKMVESLQKELIETKEYLQSVMGEQERANEELRVANEEIQSSNEEMQSTNEELETSKEELQSTNEELMTTNDELQNRSAEVSSLNNDLINLLSSINTPVIMMGKNLVIRRVTPQTEKVLNVNPFDVGRPINKIKLNVDIPDFEKILVDVMESLHPKTFDIKDKEENWFSVSIRPYRTLHNKMDGVVAIFVDITERKRAEQIAKEAREYAENIVGTVREPLIVLDRDLKVVSANRSFYQTFKVNPEETEGQFIYGLGNREWDIPKLRQLLEEILPKKTAFNNYEVEHRFPILGPRTMLLNGRRISSEANKTQMILLAIEDITERKQVEQIVEEKKNLERVNLELDSFVYTVSHDLRAPLRAIASFATFLQEDYQDKLDEQGKGHLNEIRKGANHMNELIDDLLALSQISRIQNPYEDVDINQLIQSVLERLKYDIENLQVELQVPKDLPVVHCDRVKIAEVFANLIDNAIKFSSKNNQTRPKVEIGYHDSGVDHEFYVRDHGIGIDPQYHEQIFGLFKRLHTTEEYEGTGAGLSIVKRVVNDHDGKIWVESELGKGTTVHFMIAKELQKRKKLGEILVEDKLITEEKLAEVLKKQGSQEFRPPEHRGGV